MANDKTAVVLETPGLVAFWDFQEEAGSPRFSRGGGQVYALWRDEDAPARLTNLTEAESSPGTTAGTRRYRPAIGGSDA